MASDLEFSFNALTATARRHIRVFQLHQFLDRFAMGLTVAVVALALMDRGMDLLQISLLFGVYSLTTMALELPFGGLADNIGRKPVFLAAVIASLISTALFLSSSDFFVLALSFAFIGFGRALRSGTLDAWFVETFNTAAPNIDVQPALAKAQWANAMGLAIGAVIGGLLPDAFGAMAKSIGFSIYDVSYIASFGVMFGVFIYTLFAIAEKPRPLNLSALKQGFASVPSVGVKDVKPMYHCSALAVDTVHARIPPQSTLISIEKLSNFQLLNFGNCRWSRQVLQPQVHQINRLFQISHH